MRRSILDCCLAKIDPRPRLDIRARQVDEVTVLIVHVPESGRKPHCAKPVPERHYFWRRYDDGVKLMTAAEIRESFEGDTIHRQLAEIRREVVELHHERTLAREALIQVDEGNLLQLQTLEMFLRHMEQQFLVATENDPYYRIWATPIPINKLDIQSRRGELLPILRKPEKLRHAGWDVTPVGDFRPSPVGLVCDRTDYNHLRLLWNGHIEFWTRVDDISSEVVELHVQPPYPLLHPCAIIEPVECFARLVHKVCQVADYHGEIRFGLGIYSIKGQCLLPGSPGTLGYEFAEHDIGRPDGPQPFNSERLLARPVTLGADDLPNAVAWKLASQVYCRFDYEDDEIPFFDAGHRCEVGQAQNPTQEGGS